MCNSLDAATATATTNAGSVRGESDIALRVKRVSTEAVDIVSLDLVDAQGSALPPFTAGAHIRLRVADDLVLEYSLCGPPSDSHTSRIAVNKEVESKIGRDQV